MTDELTMVELGKAIDKGEREPIEAVTRLKAAVVHPRFLGIDDSGSCVWELESGRWCWADDPYHAARQRRTFEPENYVEKYGTPVPVGTPDDAAATVRSS
jgi:hypothetical protein